MSGGWAATFTLDEPEDITLKLSYKLTQSSEYESDEYSDALVSVDGVLQGLTAVDRLARLTGDGNGGNPKTTGWQQVKVAVPGLAAGTHTVVIGAYNNQKTAANETTELLIDDVIITGPTGTIGRVAGDPGDVMLATATTGAGQPAGYTMNVTEPSGDLTTLTFAATESKMFTGVAAGDYRLEITDIPANCALSSGINPRTVTVVDGGAVSSTFNITCTATTATTGTLMIATATTGGSQPQGYQLHITGNGQTADPSIGASDTVTFTGVEAGNYSVELRAVPTNCTVSGANPRTVTVPAGGPGSTTFQVSCTTANHAPVIDAGPDETAKVGVLYQLNASFSDPDCGPWSGTIFWGDASSTIGMKMSAGAISSSHTYQSPGSYTIRIELTDSCGASGSDTKVVTVTN
jgi:hypothetical protein